MAARLKKYTFSHNIKWANCDPGLRDFIMSMIQFKPEDRPTVESLLLIPIMRKFQCIY